MSCCCCCSSCWCSCCQDAFWSGPVSADISPEPTTDSPITGSPVQAVTDVNDQPLGELPFDTTPVTQDLNDNAAYLGLGGADMGTPCAIPCSPTTHGATCNPINPCGKTNFGNPSNPSSGSAQGKGNQPATNQNVTALSNALTSLGKTVAGALSLQSATAPINTTKTSATTPTSIGIIVLVVLLGALLIAMSFREA
jgi:hypothetical protein